MQRLCDADTLVAYFPFDLNGSGTIGSVPLFHDRAEPPPSI